MGIVLLGSGVRAQQLKPTMLPDAGIKIAQSLAVDGNYAESRLMCYRILKDYPKYLDAYIIIGNTYAWDKQIDTARLFYNKVFEYDRRNAQAFNQLIALELLEKDAEGAIQLSNQALKYHPRDADILYKKANAQIMLAQNLAVDKKYDEARLICQRILDDYPDYIEVYLILGNTYSWEDINDTARSFYVKVFDYDKSNVEAFIQLIALELRENNAQRALQLAYAALEYHPDDDDVLFKMAQAQLLLANNWARDSKYEVARLLSHRILQDYPDFTEVYLFIGNTYAWENRLDTARLFFYKVFEFDNGNLEAFNQLITMELWEGDADGAIDIANMALNHNPNNHDVLLKKARALIMLGDFINAKKILFFILSEDRYNNTARELYRNIIKGVPKEITIKDNTVLIVQPVDSIFKKAQNLAWNSEFVDAIDIIELIIEAQPDFLPAQVLLAQTYAWQNEFAHARSIINSVINADHYCREGIITAIDIEYWDGDYDEAITQLDSLGLKYFPEDRDFLFKKAEILGAQGQYFQAKDIIYQMLKENPSDYRAVQYYNELKGDSFRGENNFWPDIQIDSRKRGMDNETWLKEARELAYDQRYYEAQAICIRVLDVYPEDFDAQFLMGTTMAWMGRYDESRSWYERLLSTAFDSYSLIGAIVDMETWDHNYAGALERVNYGLQIYPNDKEYLIKKVAVYQGAGEIELANTTLDQLISTYPDDKEIRKSYYNLKGLIRLNAVGAGYTLNTYALPARRTWQMYSARYYHSNDIGTFVGTVNTGYVSSDTSVFSIRGGYQFEIDAYPIFAAQKRYFHFNLGFSPSPVFARYRFGAHIYQDLVPTWELTAGVNYNYFRNVVDTANVLIFQAGVNKYWSGFMGSFSVTLAPTPLKLSQGYTLLGRKYFNRPDNWIQLAISAGVYPENPVFYLNDITITPLGLLNSYTVYAAARYMFSDRWIGQLYLGYQRQEYMMNFLRNSWTVNLSLIYLLKESN